MLEGARNALTSFHPFIAGLFRGLQPKPDLTLSEWAELNLVLPQERSASTGPYRVGDASYQRGMMDAVSDPDIDTVVFVTSSQVGKTTILSAAQGFFAEHEPSPQLSIWPTQIMADDYFDETFKPMTRESNALRGLVQETTYPGGYIAFVGANNPRDLAARPIRVVTGDELDQWGQSSGKEGSAIVLAGKRQNTFPNRKTVWASTPRLESNSPISDAFKLTRQHYFHVVCPHCDHGQILRWEEENGEPRVIFKKNEEHKAMYLCSNPSCGTLWSDLTRRRLVRDAEDMGGGWIEPKQAPFKVFDSDIQPAKSRVGFWINALYSPWSSMAVLAKELTDAGDNPEMKKAFVNTSLGLPWKGDISSFAEAESLIARREGYDPLRCPAKAGLITAAVDVQDDRIEILVIAWGSQDEFWFLNHETVPFDPSTPRAWSDVTELLSRQYPHPSGHILRIEAVCIDSGGHFTQTVYAFCARHEKQGRRVHAIRGVGGEGKPIWRLSQEKLKKGVRLWLVGVDDAKTVIYTRYATLNPGPGYVHVHEGITEKQCAQLTSERAETDYNAQGFPVRTWKKPQGARNEMLDMAAYNLAARASLNVDIDARLMALNAPKPDKTPTLEQVGALYK